MRAPIAALGPGDRPLDAPAAHYLTRVLRLAVGARFVAFDPSRALEADAEIVRSEGGSVTVRIGETRAADVQATRSVTWVHALSKGDKSDDIVRDATELGATRVIMARTLRSVVVLEGARAVARGARWEKIAREAARQSGRADPPEVTGPLSWDDALAAVPTEATRFCLHTEGGAPLAPRLLDALASFAPLAFAAGPEGGLTDSEVARAEAAGFERASLGPFVLRTETVPAAVLGACRILSTRPTG